MMQIINPETTFVKEIDPVGFVETANVVANTPPPLEIGPLAVLADNE
jgi:hypothetical protein